MTSRVSIGGPQGSKALLDAVRDAVVGGDMNVLARLQREFLSVDENVVKCVDESGNTLVHLALGRNTTMLSYVVDELRGCVNMPNNQGRTPLHEAVKNNYVECCEALLSYGADDTIQAATLSTPFHSAAACGSVECMEILLKHSVDPINKVNELDRNKCSALHKSASDGDVRVSQWLVEHGATVDQKDTNNTTPLLMAVKMGRKEVAEYLILQGADVNHHDAQKNRPVHFCAIRCDYKILSVLINSGAFVNVQNDEFNNPLHLAAVHQRPNSKEWEDLIALLLEAGCDTSLENASRKRPADLVNRNLKKIFSKEEAEARRILAAQQDQEAEEELKKLLDIQTSWRATVISKMETTQRLEKEEEDRLHGEAEERVRADDDARMLLEEAVERQRYHEEEKRKKAAAAEKSNGKKAN